MSARGAISAATSGMASGALTDDGPAAAGRPGDEAARRPIRELPERVAAQIAAGEVIERPAAVLKELLENALDAGAGRISVEIAEAGRRRIAVHDDGRGIPAPELLMAFRRHATSKLTRVDDLGRLESYGFRGEALPAIAAAAGRLRLTTRCADDPAASLIEFAHGVRSGPRPGARATGTSVEVFDLFAGQPARRAFLAGARAERAALVRAASDVVLARPERSLRLQIEGRTPLAHESHGSHESEGPRGPQVAEGAALPEAALREALASVFSQDAAERGIWFEARSERADLSLDGIAGAPDDARRTRERIRLFVNGRPVHDRRLSYAVQDAYRDWLDAGAFPLVVARLRLPPDAVDVNVHPAKTEVKLRDPDAAFSLVQRTIRESLADGRAALPLRQAPPPPPRD
ncbi:MAG: DNA mismatch repair endonuclease MutL, partial [Chloroflexota bacterium]|nr:DNA mismatch repair endonuclease MutL [Chloroflexota bacterium]